MHSWQGDQVQWQTCPVVRVNDLTMGTGEDCWTKVMKFDWLCRLSGSRGKQSDLMEVTRLVFFSTYKPSGKWINCIIVQCEVLSIRGQRLVCSMVLHLPLQSTLNSKLACNQQLSVITTFSWKPLAIDLWAPLLGWIWQKAQSLPAHYLAMTLIGLKLQTNFLVHTHDF